MLEQKVCHKHSLFHGNWNVWLETSVSRQMLKTCQLTGQPCSCNFTRRAVQLQCCHKRIFDTFEFQFKHTLAIHYWAFASVSDNQTFCGLKLCDDHNIFRQWFYFLPSFIFYAIIIYFHIVHGLHDGMKIKPFVDWCLTL